MKKITLLLFAFCISFYAQSQEFTDAPWMKELNSEAKVKRLKFQDYIDAFNEFWKKEDRDKKGSGHKPFKRWENYWKNFVKKDGTLPTSEELWNIWQQKESYDASFGAQADVSNWISLGPTDFANRDISTANIGRVNSIIVDPNNPNTYYSGAPAGGIWKSTDAGLNWTPLIDDLPQIGVSGIAIDYNDSNTIYIATGDDDAGDSRSMGVWKSTDGGTSWTATGLNPTNSPSSMNDIYIDPNNSNTLWVATNSGVFKTTDGGTNWTQTLSGNIKDIKLKPGDTSVVYAVTNDLFYKSIDGGDTFTLITSSELPAQSGRYVIDVTPANPDVVYILSANVWISSGNSNNYSFQGIYKSTDSGDTFVKQNHTGNILESTQAWYDLALAASDTNENEIYVGCLNIWKSSDGGDSFSKLNEWFQHTPSYTHADIHLLRFFNGELFTGTDGGFFKTNDGGTTFTDLTEGMEITQFYRISVSRQTSGKIAGGTQDNGGFGFASTTWNNYHGGDGMEGVIDPNSDNLYYGFMQYGQNLFVSSDSGQSGSQRFSSPNSGNVTGNWITPLAINSESEVYAGYDRIYRFTGSSWTSVSPAFGGNVDVLEIDPSNPDNMYVGYNNQLRKSTNRGTSFTTTETFDSNITSIEVNNNDSNIIYVTTAGTSINPPDANGKVFKSIDGGDTFTDITGALPGLTKNIIKHQGEHPHNPLYLGTSVGVYRYDDITQVWEPFENGLPNTTVRDLAINLIDNNITAGTYGRGLWRSDLPAPVFADDDIKLISIQNLTNNLLVCGDISPSIVVKNNGNNTVSSIDVTYMVDGGSPEVYTWNGNLASLATTSIELPTIATNVGSHQLNIEVNILNDTYSNNNTSSLTFYKNDIGVSDQVNTFEAVEDELITFNQGGGTPMWERGVPTGTVLNAAASGTSVYGTNLDGNHADKTKAFLFSRCYDLSGVIDPVLKFKMAFVIEQDWDLVYVEYSTDQGSTWSLLGSASDPNWYNSSRIAGDGLGNDCYNCVGGQWTGTNATITEYSYDLAALASESTVTFRIVYHADDAVNEEGAIIDDFYVEGITPDDDGDGVGNHIDNCPSTPNSDQADNDGDGIGDACDDDDDNDGILDINDNCQFTANADQADDNGDGIGNICDVDNDTILNDDDNCPNTPNTAQDDFDGDGLGDLCDDDDDNDGILDVNDSCKNTPLGDAIDVNGCSVFTLPSDNFQLQISSETCRNMNNGSIVISANQSLNYTANITGNGIDVDNPFTDDTTFDNLEAGTYTVCITVDGQPTYEQCFNVTITQPEDLAVASRINGIANTVTLELSGGSVYHVDLNGTVTTTTANSIELDLINGVNSIKVSTDKDCQGVYRETINNLDEIRIYPNPFNSDSFTINMGRSNVEKASVKLVSMIGKVVLHKDYTLNNGTILIEVPGLATGVYILDINDGTTTKNFKIIKK